MKTHPALAALACYNPDNGLRIAGICWVAAFLPLSYHLTTSLFPGTSAPYPPPSPPPPPVLPPHRLLIVPLFTWYVFAGPHVGNSAWTLVESYSPLQVDRTPKYTEYGWLWVYYNKIPIYPMFYLLKGDYR